jgi:hypothetical protein
MCRRTYAEEEVFNLELKAHGAGAEAGRNAERRRIMKLWETEMECSCEEPMQHLESRIKEENE